MTPRSVRFRDLYTHTAMGIKSDLKNDNRLVQ
jgi:hypothetical protein